MSINTAELGLQAARAMEYLEENDEMHDGQVVACLVGVIVVSKDGTSSFTRTFSSEALHYRQLGLIDALRRCIEDGFRFFNPAESDGDDDEE